MLLVERHIFTDQHEYFKELDYLCFLSKNLYNSSIYTLRQKYKEDKVYMNWIAVNNKFKDENQKDYRALPTRVAKQVLKSLDDNYKSFFAKVKNGDKKAKPPKYLHKTKGRFPVFYEKGAISFKKKKGLATVFDNYTF